MPIHMLQLAIKRHVNEHDNINRLLVKVGKLVKSVRKSTLNTEETDQLGVRPTNACATRWSSQLRMIQSVIRLFQKDPLWQNKLKYNVANITLNQVRQLAHLVSVLTPLADLTEKMQKELGNLGMILPAVTEIKSLLTDDTHAALPMGIAAFAETLANKKVACIMFSIPSGSASAERVFSAAGLLSRNHRMSLKPQTLSKLVFLKVNSKEL